MSNNNNNRDDRIEDDDDDEPAPDTKETKFKLVGDVVDLTTDILPKVTFTACCVKCGAHNDRGMQVHKKTEYVDYDRKDQSSVTVQISEDYGSCSGCKLRFSGAVLPSYDTSHLTDTETKKDYLLEMVQIDIGDNLWSKNGTHQQSFNGNGYVFNNVTMTVKIDGTRFKLALVEDSDDDDWGDDSDGEGDGIPDGWLQITKPKLPPPKLRDKKRKHDSQGEDDVGGVGESTE
jgi:hypothetical protein